MTEVLDKPLTRDEALKQLRALEEPIRALGITSLYLFGSTVRDEARPDSDVDLFGEVDDNVVKGLSFFGLGGRLGDLIGRKVDFIERPSLHPLIKNEVEAEGARVF